MKIHWFCHRATSSLRVLEKMQLLKKFERSRSCVAVRFSARVGTGWALSVQLPKPNIVLNHLSSYALMDVVHKSTEPKSGRENYCSIMILS